MGFFSSSGFSFLYQVGGKGTRISGDSRSVGRYHMYARVKIRSAPACVFEQDILTPNCTHLYPGIGGFVPK